MCRLFACRSVGLVRALFSIVFFGLYLIFQPRKLEKLKPISCMQTLLS
ncbi:hypothetical protein GCWU000325_00150 [Alloprevotella tannerae ATCC 51259]|uniref:Uncharacterized protein n=1 Tax=Alloprevotella tannerae ATCC 51259 TaxID=626522 RepID=C9LD36_9BACT|nr:hypothetical protein GCWU000325_00150 [Alloprevotella tannerae ATCC 51259]